MKANRVVRHMLSALLGLVLMALLFPLPPAWANGNESTDLVAPYGHFPLAIGPAPGPFTTHYLISNTSALASTVNVKCFDQFATRVGPFLGHDVALAGLQMAVRDPISLGLTADPFFTGFGWCYFASNNDDVAVTFLMGTSVGTNLITTDNSRNLMADTAQSQVTNDDGNIPYWTQEGSWSTFIVAVNPTTTDATPFTMDVFNTAGVLLGTWAGESGNLVDRDMDLTSVVDAVPASAGGFGMADIDVTGPGFVGWVVGFNGASGQAFIYPIPLDKDDTATLSSLVGIRP